MSDKGARMCPNVAFLVASVLTLVVKINSSCTYSVNKHQALKIKKYYNFCWEWIYLGKMTCK